VREQLTREAGGKWHDGAAREMMGMSSVEWSRYMRDSLGVPMEPDEISNAVVARLERRYRERVPLLPHAVEAVRECERRWPLGVASSSNRPLIDLVLELSGLRASFRATVSSEEVARGKPAPDVYLEAATRLDADPEGCGAVEDSTNGIRAASSARMRVVAIPRADFPPSAEALQLAHAKLDSLGELVGELERIA
jgi:HAD superfamily hydrolase (TIGR01509 family)